MSTTTTAPKAIAIVLSDAWAHLTRLGLRTGSPDVGMSRTELVGDAETWARARAYVANERARSKGSRKASATAALRRIDHALA